jgi:pseudaminic acid cytidylyltransferase
VNDRVNIAVIPARGGSKRIPRKNIKEFAGKPMLAWEAAKNSQLFAHVVVSTDDAEIARIARDQGAETPFIRPSELSDDHTPTVPVIAHAIEVCAKHGWCCEYVCCIYPGTPFLQTGDLTAAFCMLRDRQVDFVYPVTEYAHPIQRAMRRKVDGSMQFLNPASELARTQDLERLFHDAGQFYWGKSSAWMMGKQMHTEGVGMPIPHWRVVDIDTEDDWLRAELLFKAAFARP